MRESLLRHAEELNKARLRKRRRSAAACGLACAVTAATVLALMRPAVTMEGAPGCGLEEHRHSGDCYEQRLICPIPEGEAHTHTEDCRTCERVLVCALEEGEGHTHTEECYGTERTLTCGLSEEPHVHTGECYEQVLTCGMEEHVHGPSCFSGTEEAADWEAALAGVELTGVWPEDLVAVARTQIGYTESADNCQVTEDGSLRGYTRYGDWYGDPYGEWGAMFVSFCLYCAGIPPDGFPWEASVPRWAELLEEYGLYVPADERQPLPGDLIFFDADGDGAADRVGIVSAVSYGESEENAELAAASSEPDPGPALISLEIIEGDAGGAVARLEYDAADEAILGYAVLPAEEGGIMMLAEDGGSYTPVEAMGLTAFPLVYEEDKAIREEKYASTYGYKRGDQILPGTLGMEAITNDYRFKIEGALENLDGSLRLIPVSYIEKIFGPLGYQFDGSRPEICPIYCNSSGTIDGYAPELAKYVQYEGQWYVQVKTIAAGSDTVATVYYVYLKELATITPSSTSINVFDYWTVGQFEDDNKTSTDTDLTSGINAGHALKFGKGMGGYGKINYSQGGTDTPSRVTQGIVAASLGEDGYPCLNGEVKTDDGFWPTGAYNTSESLAYLFDPGAEADGKKSYTHITGLLTQDKEGYFYFDAQEYAAEMDLDTGQFTVYTTPAGGYMSGDVITIGEFFPFNDAHQTALLPAYKPPMNHYFGMTITARFIQQYEGYSNGTHTRPVTFEFTGDNDVWIFIDGVLVADLGGLRSAASVTINFVTGDVIIDDKTGDTAINTTIRAAFAQAGKEGAAAWSDATDEAHRSTVNGLTGQTFADNTVHTLKFYYLERGNYDSNLRLKYNLNQIPPSGIYKVDQYGGALDGARFAVYPANEDYQYVGADKTTLYSFEDTAGFTIDLATGHMYAPGTAEPVIRAAYCGVTSGGEMVFADEDGLPLSMGEIQTRFGDHFILREIAVPPGYRTVSDEICLRLDGGVIFCDNTYESGVWAGTNAMITATNTLYVAREYTQQAEYIDQYIMPEIEILTPESYTVYEGPDGKEKVADLYSIKYYFPESNQRNGTLFTVVLKRNGRDFWNGFGYDYWFPVYGTDQTGYTVVTDSSLTLADGTTVGGVPDEPVNSEGQVDYTGITYETASVNVGAAIYAAQQQSLLLGGTAGLVFEETGSGMQVLNENLPGKADRYYTWMLNNGRLAGGLQTVPDGATEEEAAAILAAVAAARAELDAAGDPQYTVAYYWTAADDLMQATPENTVRVYSHTGLVEGVQGLQLQFGTTIEVPNMENRLYVQKISANSANTTSAATLVENAIFALYPVEEETVTAEDGSAAYQICYLAREKDADGNQVRIYLGAPDPVLPNTGEARIGSGPGGAGGRYVIDPGSIADRVEGTGMIADGSGAGVITVTAADGTVYHIDPAVNADGRSMVAYTHDDCTELSTGGFGDYWSSQGVSTAVGHFKLLREGKYVMREINAPAGFALNPEEVKVLVTSDAVYANAGAADNGVLVGNGPGYITTTLDVFASEGDIDETLTWIYTMLEVERGDSFTAFHEAEDPTDGSTTWQFARADGAARDGMASGTALTDQFSQAMVTYLKYIEGKATSGTGNALFNYGPTLEYTDGGGTVEKKETYTWTDALGVDYQLEVNTGQIPRYAVNADGTRGELLTDVGERTLRLYTDVGWSKLAIYQDYAYGAAQTTTGHTTYYEDLRELGNITNLFSNSTFVRVSDQRLPDLTVTKVRQGAEGEALAGASFRLYYQAEEAGGTVTRYYYSATADSVNKWTTDGTKAAVLTTGADGTVTFTGLPMATLYLEETAAPAGYARLVNPIAIAVTAGGAAANGAALTGEETGGVTVYRLTVPNAVGYELPETGGPGTAGVTAAGLLLCAGAALLLWRGRRKKRSGGA